MLPNDEAQFTFIWAIENFSLPCHLKSPSFEFTGEETTRWNLQIDCKNSGPASVTLERESRDEGPESIHRHFRLSFLDAKGFPYSVQCFFHDMRRSTRYTCQFFKDAKKKFQMKRGEYIPNNTLTIRSVMIKKLPTEQDKRYNLCLARTVLKTDRRNFVWAIREFCSFQPGQKKTLILNPNSTSRINVICFITKVDREEFVNVAVQNSTQNEFSSVKVCLLDFERNVRHSEEKVEIDGEGALFNNFFKTSVLPKVKPSLLPNDVLHLRFEIEMNAKIVWSRIENYRYLNTTNLGTIATRGEILRYEQDESVSSSFKQAMRSLLEEGISSDVSLQAGGETFPVHKSILSARSAVFKAMFNTNMREKTSQSVEIPDITPGALRELLSYIYTDSVGELGWQGAADLYSAADKYEFLELKKKCASILMTDVSARSFGAILSLADMHQDQELRERAESFLMRQDSGFLDSDVWRAFRQKNPALACELVERMLSNLKRANGKRQKKF